MKTPATLALPRIPVQHTGVPDPRTGHGVMLMTLGGLLLGTLGVFVEEAGQHPLTAVWFRCAFGLLALCLWCAWRRGWHELRLPRRSLAWAVAAGLLMVLNWALFFAAIQRTSIAVATVAFHVQPVWVMAYGVLVLGEAAPARRWVAIAAALGGLVLATGLAGTGAAGPVGHPDFVWGVLLALGGSLSYAAVTVIAHRERQVSSLALAWWQCAVGTLVLLAWPVWHGWPAPGASWGWLAGLGVVHTGLAYVVLYAGMQRLTPSRIAVLQFVYPVAAIVFDALVYGRWLSPVQLVGVGVMGAALWAARGR